MKKSVFFVLMMILGVLLCIAALGNFYALTAEGTPAHELFTSVGLMITSLFGAVYLFTGFGKDKSARYFRAFTALYGITEWLGMLGAGSEPLPATMLLTLSFGAICVITFAENFGKRKSYLAAGVVLACEIGRAVISTAEQTVSLYGVRPISKLLLAGTVLLLIAAKYRDKAARGAE